jgi:hypothetical protein
MSPGLMATRPPAPVVKETIWNKGKPKPVERSDEERAGSFGFGIVPGVRFGHLSASTSGQTVAQNQAPFAFDDDDSSYYLEPHIDFLAILPGDYLGLGAEVGYVAGFYPGPTAGGVVEVALSPRLPLIVTGNVGAVFGTITDVTQQVRAGQTGIRYGGGLMYVVFRTRSIDGGLGLELEHYASGAASVPTGAGLLNGGSTTFEYGGTALGLDVMMSFDSGGL